MRSIVAIAGLAACAHTPEATEATPPTPPTVQDDTSEDLAQRAAAIDAQVTADLERLDELEVFEVGALIGGDASQAFHCYGECEGAEAVVDDYERRADALRELTEAAMAEPDASADACDMDHVDSQLDALRALQVVEVGAFISEQAAPSPSCYNLPCPADEEAAHQVNCARANTLSSLVDRVAGE